MSVGRRGCKGARVVRHRLGGRSRRIDCRGQTPGRGLPQPPQGLMTSSTHLERKLFALSHGCRASLGDLSRGCWGTVGAAGGRALRVLSRSQRVQKGINKATRQTLQPNKNPSGRCLAHFPAHPPRTFWRFSRSPRNPRRADGLWRGPDGFDGSIYLFSGPQRPDQFARGAARGEGRRFAEAAAQQQQSSSTVGLNPPSLPITPDQLCASQTQMDGSTCWSTELATKRLKAKAKEL